MIFIGFDIRNGERGKDLFNNLLTQLVGKQIALNLVEYYMPIIMSKKKLEEHNDEYAEILKLYDDTERENLMLKKSLNKIKPKERAG